MIALTFKLSRQCRQEADYHRFIECNGKFLSWELSSNERV